MEGKAEEVRLRSTTGGAEAEVAEYRILLDTAELDKCINEAGAVEQAKASEAGKHIGLTVVKAGAPAVSAPVTPA